MPEMTQSETPNKSKHRKKNRESHNEVERHRKKKINSGINRIGDLIPCSPALKQSKNMILEQAYKYIIELKRQNDELLLNGGDKEQACEIRKLRRELAEIQKENGRYIELLKSNDICLYDDPTLHWKGNSRSSKSSLIAPADQKFPLCLSSNQLASSNQSSTVPGITFNAGQNLQKQTANVVPVQRTCNLVTPITILDKNWQQNVTSTTSGQLASVSLPVATSAPSVADLAASKGTQTAHNSSTATPLPQSSASPQLATVAIYSQSAPLESTSGKRADANAPASSCSNLPSQPPALVSQADVPGIGLQESPKSLQGSMAVKDLVTEIFPSVAIESASEIAVSTVDVQVVSAGPSSLEPSWSLSNTLPDLKGIGSLTRIPSDGNTQTTWTTLQLAGNTVQPLSQCSSTTISALLSDQAVTFKETQINRPTPSYSIVAADNKALEPVIVKMPSCQPVQVQPFKAQPQAQNATNILPLNQSVQVIQVAQPFGAALNPAPAPAPAQNIILLQPPAPTPQPLPKPAVGQQIVIIQTAPNQSQIPIVSAQPSSSLVMPVNAANPVVCPTNQVQSVVAPQTFGGKHLVHILPRPAPVQPSSATQQVPTSTASSNPQPATISLNGQLFALQPVTPAPSSSSQAPMQIIQPTTCEDPNTNVALNTFGALANLSQSISQMAGQNCVQLTLNPSAAASVSTNTMPVNCVSLPGTAATPVTAETPSVVLAAPALIKTLPAKPAGGVPPSLKPKKPIKKPSAKKGSALKKESIPAAKSDPVCPESQKTQVHDEGVNHNESAAVVIAAQDTVGDAESNSQETDRAQMYPAPCAVSTPMVVDEPVEEPVPGESASEEQVPTKPLTSESSVRKDVFINPGEQRAPLVGKDCPKVEVVSSALPVNDLPLQDSLQDEPGVIVDGQSTTELKDCLIQGDTANVTAATMLEVRVLPSDPNASISPEKANANEPNCNTTLSGKNKLDAPVTTGTQIVPQTESVISTASVVHIAQNQTNSSENEVVTGSCVSSQQADSPLSNSSTSSRNFSVASMLPDNRDHMAKSISSVPAFTGCGFSEQSEMVAAAAKVIFEQEDGTKLQTDEASQAVSRNTVEVLSGNCHLSFKPSSSKHNVARLQPLSNTLTSVEANAHPNQDRLVNKGHCPIGLSATSLPLQIATSHSQSIPSLSINNLIHQGDVGHSIENCARVTQTSNHLHLTSSTNLSVSSSSYDRHSEQSAVLSEYRQEEMRLVKPSATQVAQGPESHLKHNLDNRKETSKRAAHSDDLLLVKRQKQCQGPLGLERLQPTENVPDQNKILVSHISSDPSTSLPGSIQGHGEGIPSMFTSNNFVNSNLRPGDMQCTSQPPVSEQSQLGHQHLQPLQQHQHATILHNNNSYIKQQQAGHLRDQQHLYQQQHHHLLTDPVRSQSHSASHSARQQQQRLMQQDAQMQKKRASVQGTQVARLSLQQKPLSEQNRQNNGQPHPHHQQIQQQMPPHFGAAQAEKSCESSTTPRVLHNAHQQNHTSQDIHHQHQQDVISRVQAPAVSSEHLTSHGQVQRLMTSRSLEQQMATQASVVSRPANHNLSTAHRQERNRVSSYSAEALIGKSTSNAEQRIGISVHPPRVPEQMEMRKYLDVSRNKNMPPHNIQNRMTIDHSVNTDSQRLLDCQTFKPSGLNQQQPTFEVQTSRNNDGSATASMRSLQSQSYRITQNAVMDRQKHLPYQSVQEVPGTNSLPIRDGDGSCHQNFMQSLLAPHIGEPVGTGQRPISVPQRPPYNSANIEFACPPARDALHLRPDADSRNRESCDLVMGQVTRNNSLNIPFSSSSGDLQGRNTSPHNSIQKSNSMRQVDSQGAKNQNIQASINMHGVAHPPIPHQSVSHGNVDQRQTVRQVNVAVSQRSRHPLQDETDSKSRQSERNRAGAQRHGNMFDPALPHLPLAGTSSMILGRQQAVADKRAGIRFMPEGPQVPSDNSVSDQHTLTQNFAFPFIPEGTMNPPINANASFIPPVTQAAATRTTALIPVDPQNTLPSFYPPYSPAHPSLSNDLTLPYFSNQMFPNPSTEKTNGTGLNNRFGSILSPPRPVGFSQTTFPLLPEMPPMHVANPSHLSNFNLTSLFPEIATALPADGSAMSPLLPISHPSASDSSKQTSNRPAHNISHILGHDSSSAV
ncbi:basic helix-loop-helix domain-containing protein USF3 [Gastrophryne carolinensis]